MQKARVVAGEHSARCNALHAYDLHALDIQAALQALHHVLASSHRCLHLHPALGRQLPPHLPYLRSGRWKWAQNRTCRHRRWRRGRLRRRTWVTHHIQQHNVVVGSWRRRWWRCCRTSGAPTCAATIQVQEVHHVCRWRWCCRRRRRRCRRRHRRLLGGRSGGWWCCTRCVGRLLRWWGLGGSCCAAYTAEESGGHALLLRRRSVGSTRCSVLGRASGLAEEWRRRSCSCRSRLLYFDGLGRWRHPSWLIVATGAPLPWPRHMEATANPRVAPGAHAHTAATTTEVSGVLRCVACDRSGGKGPRLRLGGYRVRREIESWLVKISLVSRRFLGLSPSASILVRLCSLIHLLPHE
mmetsp:Transcript_15558/g.32948  ORF Transcript_15558/g.32948 Transcript_15558/m.32948 type:complete len:353 (-) Transcript_15558:1974-3032(-)